MSARARTDRSIRSANAEFQLLEALVANRTKRHRQGRFLVQGVRAIEAALAVHWPLSTVLLSDAARSRWAEELAERAEGAEPVRVAADLLDRLSGREDGAEAVLVARTLGRRLAEVSGPGPLVVVEGTQNPGNLGTIFRSAAAFGASGVVVTGHAADPYDPRCVRASGGALFGVPFVVARSLAAVADGLPGRVVALDPGGRALDEIDLSGPLTLLAGNERTGLSRAAGALSAELASIPLRPPVDSLNVAVAVSVALAECDRRTRLAQAPAGASSATTPGVPPR